MGSANVFSSIDLKSGYWQIEMDEKSIPITAFSTPDGHYEFLRLPFGLKNGPSFFSRVMATAFAGVESVQVYIDDIFISSKNNIIHMKQLRDTFERLKLANLKVCKTKCHFFKNKIKVLGHIIENGKIMMDEERIKAVKNWPQPRKPKHVRQFLGLCNGSRKFIKDYAKISLPLNKLTKKDVQWSWTEECESAFKMLKEKITSSPVLRIPDLSKPFKLYTDASGLQIGAVLTQVDEEGNEYVVAYASRPLRGAELHYGITEKECLAVVWAVKKFRVYLYGNYFIIVTDHSALLWLMKIKDANGKLARWAIGLQTYNFQIVHRPGRLHSNADALSRAFAVIEELKENHEEDRSIKELDPWEDEIFKYWKVSFWIQQKTV